MAESQLHLDMKQWSAERYLKQGVEQKNIVFEKAFWKRNLDYRERTRYSRAM